jgi:hypothetical protein
VRIPYQSKRGFTTFSHGSKAGSNDSRYSSRFSRVTTYLNAAPQRACHLANTRCRHLTAISSIKRALPHGKAEPDYLDFNKHIQSIPQPFKMIHFPRPRPASRNLQVFAGLSKESDASLC